MLNSHTMSNTSDKQCKIPCWTWIIIVIIVVTIIAATIYGISSAISYEKSEKESKIEKTTEVLFPIDRHMFLSHLCDHCIYINPDTI